MTTFSDQALFARIRLGSIKIGAFLQINSRKRIRANRNYSRLRIAVELRTPLHCMWGKKIKLTHSAGLRMSCAPTGGGLGGGLKSMSSTQASFQIAQTILRTSGSWLIATCIFQRERAAEFRSEVWDPRLIRSAFHLSSTSTNTYTISGCGLLGMLSCCSFRHVVASKVKVEGVSLNHSACLQL